MTEGGLRKDEDLIKKWKQKRGNANFEYLENKTDLENLKEDTDFGWFHLHLTFFGSFTFQFSENLKENPDFGWFHLHLFWFIYISIFKKVSLHLPLFATRMVAPMTTQMIYFTSKGIMAKDAFLF